MDKKYYKIDASKMPLGRIATRVSVVLRGKNDPSFSANVLPDHIVLVENAEKVNLSAKKELSKRYYHYSGYHGGLKTKKFAELKDLKPEEIIKSAIRGMLPKNRLQNEMLKNLKIFKGGIQGYEKETLIQIEE